MNDDAGLKVTVSADVQQLQTGASQATASLQDMEKELNLLGRAIDSMVSKGQDITKLEDAYQALADKIKAARAEAAQPIPTPPAPPQPPPVPVPDDKPLLDSISKQRLAFMDLGRVVTGQGFNLRSLAANFSLLGAPVAIAAAAIYGLYEVLSKQTDAEKKAAEQAKELANTLANLKDVSTIDETATGSEAGNIARVQALAAVVEDTNKAYKDRQNALNELKETNKSYFGDLTLEASSMKLLTDRVNQYSQALITEAIIKGQVEEIAKLSEELQKQIPILNQLTAARDAQADATDKAAAAAQKSGDNTIGAGGSGSAIDAQTALDKSTAAYLKQNAAVADLKDQIKQYTDELNKQIIVQADQRPLTVPPKTKSDLQDIVSVLKEVQSIYADLAKPSKLPLFQQNQNSGANLPAGQTSPVVDVINAQIAAAKKKLADPATTGDLADAYGKLIAALNAKLQATLHPNLISPVDQALTNPEDAQKAIDTAESKIEKAFGDKGLGIKVPANLTLDIRNTGFDDEDTKKIQQELERTPGLSNFFVKASANVQVAIGKAAIDEADLRNLKETIDSVVSSTAISGFKDIGVALGDALSGAKNPLASAVKDFTAVLGDGLIKIGEQMIAASALMQALKATLSTLYAIPAAGVLVGIAAVALGEVVKNVGAHAFATGGIVTGPTLGLVGEAGPEVIFPLNQLNRFIQGQPGRGDQNINIRGRISGNDLKLSLARTNKQQGLV